MHALAISLTSTVGVAVLNCRAVASPRDGVAKREPQHVSWRSACSDKQQEMARGMPYACMTSAQVTNWAGVALRAHASSGQREA